MWQVTKDVLMMNMDGEFLEEVGAVTKAQNLRKKEVQMNTRMHYTQRRRGFVVLPSMHAQVPCFLRLMRAYGGCPGLDSLYSLISKLPCSS